MIDTSLKHYNILYLEDEPNIRANISKMLTYYFSKVFAVENVAQAVETFENNRIDIILSDISMPGENGLDFVKYIREQKPYLPIILLTAHTDTHYLLDATKLKLIDYLTKPVDFDELTQALIKAGKECPQVTNLQLPNQVEYNFQTREIFKNKERVSLTHKELLLFEYLLEHKDKTVSKEELFEHIWDDYYKATESALKSLLNKLRKKIGKESIKNISGIGYQLQID